MVENGYADFEEFKDLNEDELAEKIKEKYLLIQKNYNNNFEKICKKSELSIINESKNVEVWKIIKNYFKNKNVILINE